MEPRIYTDTKSFGHHTLKFSGERWGGEDGIYNTKVEIIPESGDKFTLCWITWEDREMFAKKLNDTIYDHAI